MCTGELSISVRALDRHCHRCVDECDKCCKSAFSRSERCYMNIHLP